MRIITRRIAYLFFLAMLVNTFAGVSALAQVKRLPPKNTTVIKTTAGPRPDAPNLLHPASGTTEFMSDVAPTELQFNWVDSQVDPNSIPRPGRPIAPLEGTIPITHYQLCITDKSIKDVVVMSAVCRPGTKDAVIYPAIANDFLEAQLPARYAGKTLRWTAAACNANGCNWQSSPHTLVTTSIPDAPTLRGPAKNITFWNATAAQPMFKWWSTQVPHSYRLCVTRTSGACPIQETATADTLVTVIEGADNKTTLLDVKRFIGSTVNWTAAACNRKGQCTYSPQKRPLTVSGFPEDIPELLSPQAGEAVDYKDTQFIWTHSEGATHYDLCITKPNIACGDGNSHVERVNATVQRKSLEIPAQFVTAASATNNPRWTVAACNEYGCRLQQQARPFRFQAWDVTLNLTRIRFYETCDTWSDGDYMVQFSASGQGAKGTAYHDQPRTGTVNWPDEGAANISDHERDVAINRTIVLRGVDPHSPIVASVLAVDCDDDKLLGILVDVGGIAMTAVGVPGYAIMVVKHLVKTTAALASPIHCEGEEIYESSGNNDAGVIWHLAGAEEWKVGLVPIEGVDVESIPGYGTCGNYKDRFFRTYLNVRGTQR